MGEEALSSPSSHWRKVSAGLVLFHNLAAHVPDLESKAVAGLADFHMNHIWSLDPSSWSFKRGLPALRSHP